MPTVNRGALAPVIGLAIYQSDAVAHEFSTFGYLVGIVAVLSLTMLPRGKFVQTLVLNLLFLVVGAAFALLALWSALQARLHTQTAPDDPRSPRPTYNSSQAAVSGLWLFANIWIVNTIRAKYPSLNVPSVVYSILTNISCTYSPMITTNAAFQSLVARLLTAMLTGFAIATATSLLILPVSSRAATTAQLKGAIMILRGAVKQEKAYLQSLEREDMFAIPADICAATHLSDSGSSTDGAHMKEQKNSKENNKVQAEPESTAEAKAIKETLFNLRLLTGKIFVDLPFAKRDIAWAKLAAKDLTAIVEHYRGVVVPIHGIGTVIDIFQRLAERRGWVTTPETPLEVLAEKNEDKRIWNKIMKQLHEPFEQLSVAIDEGLQHAGMLLEILPRPKAPQKSRSVTDADVESKGNLIQPGDAGFAKALEGKIQSLRDVRGTILAAWAKEKGLLTDDSSLDEIDNVRFHETDSEHRRDQGQLYILLYIETLVRICRTPLQLDTPFRAKRLLLRRIAVTLSIWNPPSVNDASDYGCFCCGPNYTNKLVRWKQQAKEYCGLFDSQTRK
jgi:gas vesicle protein